MTPGGATGTNGKLVGDGVAITGSSTPRWALVSSNQIKGNMPFNTDQLTKRLPIFDLAFDYKT